MCFTVTAVILKIQPLKTNYIYIFSPYRAVNTLYFGYETPQVDVVNGNYRCSEIHTDKYPVWAKRTVV